MIMLISVVLPCWPKHRDRIISTRYNKALVVPSCPAPEVRIMLRHRFVLKSETRSCIGAETTSEKVSGQCVGWARNRVLRHGRRRTCPLVIQLFRPRLDLIKLHSRPASSCGETPFVTAPVPETPTIPSVAKRWRSGTLHLGNPVSKRWRSNTLHPGTPVPTTTPPQLRWRAAVLRALRPFRRLRDNTIRSLGTFETISIGSGSGDVDSFGETL